MMLDPGTGIIIFMIAGIGGVVTYVAFQQAEKVGPTLKLEDLLPPPPDEGPPFPKVLLKGGGVWS